MKIGLMFDGLGLDTNEMYIKIIRIHIGYRLKSEMIYDMSHDNILTLLSNPNPVSGPVQAAVVRSIT